MSETSGRSGAEQWSPVWLIPHGVMPLSMPESPELLPANVCAPPRCLFWPNYEGALQAASGWRGWDSGCRFRVVRCRPQMSSTGLLNLKVSCPAARSRCRPSLADP